MSKTARETTTATPKLTECPVRATEYYVRRNDRYYATRAEITGTLARGGKSLVEIDRSICAARGTELIRDPDDHSRLIPATDDETLGDLLEDYIERSAEPNPVLIGRINARRQELREGGDT